MSAWLPSSLSHAAPAAARWTGIHPVPDTATMSNLDRLVTGRLTPIHSATLSSWGLTSICATRVPSIQANGTTNTTIIWGLTGVTGTVVVRAVVDTSHLESRLSQDSFLFSLLPT